MIIIHFTKIFIILMIVFILNWCQLRMNRNWEFIIMDKIIILSIFINLIRINYHGQSLNSYLNFKLKSCLNIIIITFVYFQHVVILKMMKLVDYNLIVWGSLLKNLEKLQGINYLSTLFWDRLKQHSLNKIILLKRRLCKNINTILIHSI